MDEDKATEEKAKVIDEIMKLDPIVAKQRGVYKLFSDELGPDFIHPAQSIIPGSEDNKIGGGEGK